MHLALNGRYSMDIIELLIEQNCDINAQGKVNECLNDTQYKVLILKLKDGNTPLHILCQHIRSTTLVRRFLLAGADYSIENNVQLYPYCG